jgi:hypothetical protein
MAPTIIIALLLLALATFAWHLERARADRDKAREACAKSNLETGLLRDRVRQHEDLIRITHEDYTKAADELANLRESYEGARELLAQTRQRTKPRPARIVEPEGMDEDRVAEILAGTAATTPVMAITALLSRHVVATCDRATDEPREQIADGTRTLAPYTPEMRLHDAGKAYAFAQALAEIQELTAAREEKKAAA